MSVLKLSGRVTIFQRKKQYSAVKVVQGVGSWRAVENLRGYAVLSDIVEAYLVLRSLLVRGKPINRT